MPTEESQGQPNNNSENTDYTPPVDGKKDVVDAAASREQSDTRNNGKKGEDYKEPKEVRVTVTQQDDKELRNDTIKTNRFNRIGVFVNIFLAILTLIAVIAALWSADIANKTLEHAIAQDERNKEREEYLDKVNKEQNRINDENNRMTNKRADKSLQAQIDLVNESHNQFKIENEPYLQAADFYMLKKPEVYERINGGYFLMNTIQTTVKLVSSKYIIGIRNKRFNKKDIDTAKETNVSLYVSQGIKEPIPWTVQPIDETVFHQLMTDTAYGIYLYQEIKYKTLSLSPNKTKTYHLQVKIRWEDEAPTPSARFMIIESVNY